MSTESAEYPEIDDGIFGHIILSLDACLPQPITALAAFERAGHEPGGEWWYQLGTITIDEPDTERRVDALDAAISTLLHLLDDVAQEVLFDERSVVRLFITFGGGAQTLSPRLIHRIAAVNATLWIDT